MKCLFPYSLPSAEYSNTLVILTPLTQAYLVRCCPFSSLIIKSFFIFQILF